MSYLDFIILNKIHWRKFNAHGGIGIAFLTGGNKYTDFNYDLIYTIGLSYSISRTIEVETRFRYGATGLISMQEENIYSLESARHIQNMSVQFGLTYAF